jgi:uncharacterized DUF497 family protein
VEFEWDSGKAEAKLRKQRVSFEDAARVFLDPRRIETVDDRENYGEDRWKTVGLVDPLYRPSPIPFAARTAISSD